LSQQTTLFETELLNEPKHSGSLIIGARKKQLLTKAQQTFNRLSKQVEKLQKEIESQEKDFDACLAFYGSEIYPVEKELADTTKQLVKLLHRFYLDRKLLSKKEKKVLKEILANELKSLFSLEKTPPDDEVKTIFKNVEGVDYDKAAEEDFKLMREETEAMFESMGVDFDMSDVTRDSFEEDMARKAKEFQERRKAEHEEEANKKAARNKTAKQLEREAKEKQKEEARQRGISVIYRQLVKALHPDLERDEARKAEKGALMQEAVAAYEKNDLHSLLRLEMQWLNKESDHLDSLSNEKIEVYIQLLKEQAEELKLQRDMVGAHPKYQPLMREHFGLYLKPASMFTLKNEKKELENEITSKQASIRALNGSNPVQEISAIIHEYNTAP